MLFLGITFPARVAQQTYHFLYHPELYKAGSQRKPYGASQQQGNEDVGPEQVVYQIYYSHNVYVQLSICSKKLTQNKCYPLSLSKVVSVVTLGYLCRYSRLPLSLTEIDSLQVDDNQRGMNSCAAICTMDKSGQT